MAKKKNENSLQYLQMPLPSGGRYSKMTKVAFGGLNKRIEHDSGELTMEYNISTSEYPYLTPSQSHNVEYSGYYEKGIRIPISMTAFDGFLLVIYRDGLSVKVDYILKNGTKHTGVIKTYETTEPFPDWIDEPRSIVQFNVYIQSIDIVNGEYEKRYLIFPDKVSLHTNIVKSDKNPTNWEASDFETASRSALYYYGDGDDRVYFTVGENDKGELSAKLSGEKGYFQLDGMSVDIKEYQNSTPMKDEDGNDIEGFYPPPDTSSHNYYYKNTYVFTKPDGTPYTDTNIYRWVDDEVDSENSGWKVSFAPTMPDIKYATVHLSRLFGVSDDCVYASGFNAYTNWNLDTIDEYNESNAWQSKAQSNTKADGNFTGIINFQGHVVCFKRDFMHEIYNTKNPFRIQDIYAEGAIDHRTLQDVDGKLIFVSEDDVKIYTGSNPRIIGYPLNMPRYEYAVSGTDNRNYYLYCESRGKSYLYVYDTYTELWSEQGVGSRVLSFAHNKNGMYMLCENGIVYQIDTEDYEHSWSFETDLITNKSVDIKHIKKIQMLVEHPSNAALDIFILYDDEEFDKLAESLEYQKRLVYNTYGKGKCGKYPIRIKPRKTANYGFKLHIEGYGYVKIYGLEVFIESGGDMYV